MGDFGETMRILVIENFGGTGLGQLETALAERHAEITYCRPHLGEALPDGPFDGMIVLGGGQNALDDDIAPWFPELLERMRNHVEQDRALLGVCLGSQLLARAYDGQNLVGATHEFGWHEIALTPDGRDDPLLDHLNDIFVSFQWHDDTFVLPRGAVRLAGNDAAHNQAFRIGRAGYGIQFHFEADRKMVDVWSESFAGWIAEQEPDWPQRRAAEAPSKGAQADANGLAIARAWVALV